MRGDKATGRRTLPVAIGEKSARLVCAALIIVLPICTHYVIFDYFGYTWMSLLLELLLAFLNVTAVLRILMMCNTSDDDITYKIHTGWFCSISLGAAFVF